MSDYIANFSIEETEPITATFKAYDEPPSVGGTTDYRWLENKPSINNVTLVGDLSLGKLGIQPVGDYATTSQIPEKVSQLYNDLTFVSYTEVMNMIASIPQFKLSFVNELPSTGEKMTLYLVPKEGADDDVYNEYIWLETASKFEFIGSTSADMTDYVKKTDYATSSKAGVVKVQSDYGIGLTTDNAIRILPAGQTEIAGKTNSTKAITPSMLNYAVNQVLLTMSQPSYDDLVEEGGIDENLFYFITE